MSFENPKTGDCPDGQKVRHKIFSDKNYSANTMERWRLCHSVQFHHRIRHIPGKNNTAADYLSRLEISPKEKLSLRIREDIPTTPIELHVHSAGVSEEEQIFYTEDDDETEEQNLQRKKDARDNPANQLPDILSEKYYTQ